MGLSGTARRMANPYIHNSVLTEAQVRDILRSYTGFVPPTDAAALHGVSRQTTSGLYLKFSRRLHEAWGWERVGQYPTRQDIGLWLDRTEMRDAYDHYRNGSSLAEYGAARAGKMLSPDEYGPILVAQELKNRWGKISEKNFLYHYALIKRIAECRIDWMQLFGTENMASPNVVQAAANQVFNDIEMSLRKSPLGR